MKTENRSSMTVETGADLAAKNRKHRRRMRLFGGAAAVVVFITTYMLILPAITLERDTACGLAEHTHEDACYSVTETLTCGQEEESDHVHTEACYTAERTLTCTLPEHTHTEDCCTDTEDTVPADAEAAPAADTATVDDAEEVGNTEATDSTEAAEDTDEAEAQEVLTILPETPLFAEASEKAASADNDVLDTTGAIDFADYITDLSVSKNTGSSWTGSSEFTEGETVRVDISYSIPAGVVTVNNRTIYYNLDGFLDPDNMPPDGNVTDAGGNVCGTYRFGFDENGHALVIITFDEDFADGNAFDGTLFFQTQLATGMTEDESGYTFPGTGTSIVVHRDTSKYDLSASKSAQTNKYHDEEHPSDLYYTVTYSSEYGTEGSFVIEDTMYALKNDGKTAITSEAGATVDGTVTIQKYDANGQASGAPIILTDKDGASSFSTTVDGLQAGEKYVMTYYATPTYYCDDSVTNYFGYIGVQNKATGTLTHDPDVVAKVTVNSRIRKTVAFKTGTFNSVTDKITWTITIRNEDREDLAGRTVADVLENAGLSVVSATITNSDTGETTDIGDCIQTWDQAAAQSISGRTFTGSSYGGLAYTFPEGSTASEYVITLVSTTTTSNTSQKNYFNYEDYHGQASVTVSHRTAGIVKSKYDTAGSADYATYRKQAWRVVITPDPTTQLQNFTYMDLVADAYDQDRNMIDDSHYFLLSDFAWGVNTMLITAYDDDGNALAAGTNSEIWTEVMQAMTITFCDVDDESDLENMNVIWSGSLYDFINDNAAGGYAKPSSITAHANFFTVSGSYTRENCNITKLSFTYFSHVEFPDRAGNYNWHNYAQYGEKSSSAYYTRKIQGYFEKQVYTGKYINGSTTEDRTWEYLADNAYYMKNYVYTSEDGAEVPYGDGVLTYRVLVNAAAGDINLTDTIPNGMEFVEGSAYATVAYFSSSATEAGETAGGSYEGLTDEPYYLVDHLTASVSGNTLSLQLTDYPGVQFFNNYQCYVAFYYSLRITDWDNVKETVRTYTNSVELEGGNSDSISHSVIRDRDDVTKEAEYDEDNQTITYTLLINPLGKDLDPDHENLVLTDTLSAEQGEAVLDLSSVVLQAYDPNTGEVGEAVNPSRYTYTYDTATRTLTVTLPDEMPCQLTYTYVINPLLASSDYTVSNTVTMNGETKAAEQIEAKHAESGASVVRKLITLYKVDAEDYSTRLPGVEFTLSRYDTATGSWVDVAAGANCRTDANGEIRFVNSADNNGIVLQQHVLYRLVETKTVSGYALNTTPYYFLWLDGTIAGHGSSEEDWWNAYGSTLSGAGASQAQIIFLNNGTGSIYIPNQYTLVSVKKAWVNVDGTDMTNPPDYVTVQLNRVTNGTSTAYGETVTLSADNDWTYAWDSLPNGSYTVTELTIAGVPLAESRYEASYSVTTGITHGTIVVTNKEKPTSVELSKVWDIPEGADVTTPEYIIFDLLRDGKVIGSYKLTGTTLTANSASAPGTPSCTGSWAGSISGLPEGYHYTIEETYVAGTPLASTNFTADCEKDPVTGVWVLTNTYAPETYELPNTGGTGTTPFTWAGIGLMTAALVTAFSMRRRTGRRHST